MITAIVSPRALFVRRLRTAGGSPQGRRHLHATAVCRTGQTGEHGRAPPQGTPYSHPGPYAGNLYYGAGGPASSSTYHAAAAPVTGWPPTGETGRAAWAPSSPSPLTSPYPQGQPQQYPSLSHAPQQPTEDYETTIQNYQMNLESYSDASAAAVESAERRLRVVHKFQKEAPEKLRQEFIWTFFPLVVVLWFYMRDQSNHSAAQFARRQIKEDAKENCTVPWVALPKH